MGKQCVSLGQNYRMGGKCCKKKTSDYPGFKRGIGEESSMLRTTLHSPREGRTGHVHHASPPENLNASMTPRQKTYRRPLRLTEDINGAQNYSANLPDGEPNFGVKRPNYHISQYQQTCDEHVVDMEKKQVNENATRNNTHSPHTPQTQRVILEEDNEWTDHKSDGGEANPQKKEYIVKTPYPPLNEYAHKVPQEIPTPSLAPSMTPEINLVPRNKTVQFAPVIQSTRVRSVPKRMTVAFKNPASGQCEEYVYSEKMVRGTPRS